jgi:hypothetical protein
VLELPAKVKRPAPKKAAGSGLERTFETLWARYGRWYDAGIMVRWIPEREHRFHESRRWRVDFAWPEQKVAVEIEGGVFSGGRHTRGAGFVADCDKYNALAAAGWRLFRFTEKHLAKRPVQCCELVAAALASEGLAERSSTCT